MLAGRQLLIGRLGAMTGNSWEDEGISKGGSIHMG